MAYKLEFKGTRGQILRITDTLTDVEYINIPVNMVRYKVSDSNDFSFYQNTATPNRKVIGFNGEITDDYNNEFKLGQAQNGDEFLNYPFADLVDATSSPFTSVSDLKDILDDAISFNPVGQTPQIPLYISQVGGQGQPNTNNIVFVSQKSDLPTAVAGVITLATNITYFFTNHVDLTGDRIVCSQNTTILGASSENCSITSTGLTTDYLISSEYTLPIRHITIKDVNLGIGINTSGTGVQPIALDWTGVNFSGTSISLTCGEIDNFIFSKGAILSGGGFVFSNTVGTIGIDNSLFVGSGSAYTMIELTASCVVTRRFRTIYSSFVAPGSTVAITVNNLATIPVDSYILDTCNFSGGGTYLQGIGSLYTDNEPRWINNKGILNTTSVGNYFMSNNATTTVISSSGVATKILGTTTANAINQKFTHTDNRLTYSGELQLDFEVTAVASFTGTGSNKKFGLYIAKNGTIISSSEMYATTDGNNRAESIGIQTIVTLINSDYIEVWIENDTDSTDVTVQYLNLIAKQLN